MKKECFFYFLYIFISHFSYYAQKHQNSCWSVDYLEWQYYNKRFQEGFYRNEQKVNLWLSDKKNADEAKGMHRTVVTIPVVFHVVYKNAAQNIPDSLIHSQIQVLNECFRKQNANYVKTRPVFDSLGADVELEFCLAQRDPGGNLTSGIIRKQAPANASFNPLTGFDNVKKPSKGGDTIWNPRHYLNVWVCDMSILGFEVVLGYAQFPGMDSLTDGVVIQYNYVGKYSKPGFLGRTTVHEVGHWLGLRHIWADDDLGSNPQSKYCDSTDYVEDTPNQGPRSQSNCNLSANTCSLESAFWGNLNPPDMVENYMDYSRDSCMTLFTKGQKARMYGFLNTDPIRKSVLTSTAGCNAPVGISVNPEILLNDLILYPNPAENTISIRSRYGMKIISVKAIQPERKIAIELKKNNEEEYDLSCLPWGLYILEIYTSNGKFYRKIIKQ